jgi:hypothetical protein
VKSLFSVSSTKGLILGLVETRSARKRNELQEQYPERVPRGIDEFELYDVFARCVLNEEATFEQENGIVPKKVSTVHIRRTLSDRMRLTLKRWGNESPQ